MSAPDDEHQSAILFIAPPANSTMPPMSFEVIPPPSTICTIVAPTTMLHRSTITGPATMLHSVTTPNIWLTNGIVAMLATMLIAKAVHRLLASLLPANCSQPFVVRISSILSASLCALPQMPLCLSLTLLSGMPHSTIAATEMKDNINPALYNHLPSHTSIRAATAANLLRGSPPRLALIANCSNVNISAARTIEGVAPATRA